MANDIFGYKRNPKPKGVFSLEDSLLILGKVGKAEGYLIQDWRLDYAQDVQELFEIGSNALYWQKSRPRGNGTLRRIVGAIDADSPNKGFFPAEAYDLCLGGALITLQAQGGHCTEAPKNTGGVKLDKKIIVDMDGCIVTSLGFTMQVGDMMLQENIAWRFAKMEIK
jgi:hypothetical protein